MIISDGKPHVIENEDRWGRPDGTYRVNEPVRVGQALWDKLWKYENFDTVAFGLAEGAPRQLTADQYARMVEAAIRSCPQVSTVWQFDGDTLDCKDKVRLVAIFNQPHLVAWSWFDTHVRYPLARARAWWLNHTKKPVEYDIIDIHGHIALKDARLTPERQKLLERIDAGDIDEDCGP